MNHNIAAIATPHGEGGIAIVRISGEKAIEVVNKYLSFNLKDKDSNTINFGYFKNEKNEIIDEVLVSVMRAPRTFTGENTVEINCHGGIFITNKILETLLQDEEIELAEPGEFSKRAFLNGKKSLTEAESLMDIIKAGSEQSHQMALKALKGETKTLIEQLRNELMNIIAQIEVNIDYPEYEDIEEITQMHLQKQINNLEKQINNIIIDSKKGELIKEGIKTALIGAPNVGKSSLLNRLSRSEKAIVTEIAGTTRDVIESSINIGEVTLNLVDTAGIRKTDNLIEQIGIEKSQQMIEEAELILHILDASRELTDEEKELVALTKAKRTILIINKTDNSRGEIEKIFPNAIQMSVLNNQGLNLLEQEIIRLFDLASFDVFKSNYVTNTRHISKLEYVKTLLVRAKENIEIMMPMDIIEIDLKEAMFTLGEILGIEVKDDLLNELFSRFCLGK